MEPCRQDVIVEGRRYRRFIYSGETSTKFNESNSAPLTLKEYRQESERKKKDSKKQGSGVKPSEVNYTGLDETGQPIQQIDGHLITSTTKEDGESLFSVSISDVPTAISTSALSSLDNSLVESSASPPSGGVHAITLTSSSLASLQENYYKFTSSLLSARENHRYTHFFCIPFAEFAPGSSKLVQSTSGSKVIQDATKLWPELQARAPDLIDTYRIPATKLHTTLFLLTLLSKKEIEAAVQAVKAAAPIVYDSVGGTSVLVNLQGLKTFGHTEKAKVLYLNLTEAGKPGQDTISSNISAGSCPQRCPRLARIVGVLSQSLIKHGVLTERSAKKQHLGENGINCGVEWHLTIANTKYGKKRGETFNATNILEQMGDFGLGTHRAPCVQLCRLDQKAWMPKVETIPGYYTIETSIPLP